MSVGLLVGGRYELTARIGGGGFGTVWRAHDTTLGRDVAIKLIALDRADSHREALVERFWREARAVASLNHPNIVTAHDFGVQDDSAYLVMELISGGSLADELASRRASGAGPLDVARVARLGAQISAGLAAAHVAGLVHRDLKPANVMVVRPSGQAKIVDFGIARIGDLARLTVPGDYLGTLPYASPEQMRTGQMDGRSDLYSLGCLLYELLTGRSPYQAESPAQWISAHQSAPPAPLRQLLPTVPADFDALMRDLLAKDPAHRPPGADAVRVRLERIASGTPAGPPPTLIEPRLPGPRLPAVVATPYGWQPRMTPTPYGWRPMTTPAPQRPMPPARPVTTTTAGRLLMAIAICGGVEALLAVVAVGSMSTVVTRAFLGIPNAHGGDVVVYLMGVVISAVIGTAIVGVLAGANLRGNRAGRIWTWVLAPPFVFVFFAGLGSRQALTTAATPHGADLLRPRVVRALAEVRQGIPGWYISMTTLLNLIGLVMIVAVVVLLATPASGAYIAARRGRRR